MKVLNPGIEYYAERIASEVPFSFIKYADGELRLAIPLQDIPWNNRLVRMTEEGLDKLYKKSLTNCPISENYIVALWRQSWFSSLGRLEEVEAWFSENLPKGIHWHDGMVWQRAIFIGTFAPILTAIRDQSLPVVLIGPSFLRDLERLAEWKVVKHFVTDYFGGYELKEYIRREVQTREPSFYIFAAGSLKLLIPELWEVVGQHSFMIDFGSALEPLCGHCPGHTGYWNLTLRTLWENLGRTTRRGKWGNLL